MHCSFYSIAFLSTLLHAENSTRGNLHAYPKNPTMLKLLVAIGIAIFVSYIIFIRQVAKGISKLLIHIPVFRKPSKPTNTL